jgi:hypothetical protein
MPKSFHQSLHLGGVVGAQSLDLRCMVLPHVAQCLDQSRHLLGVLFAQHRLAYRCPFLRIEGDMPGPRHNGLWGRCDRVLRGRRSIAQRGRREARHHGSRV